jgi:hypothetical protein
MHWHGREDFAENTALDGFQPGFWRLQQARRTDAFWAEEMMVVKELGFARVALPVSFV